MTKTLHVQSREPAASSSKHSGDVEYFPSGRLTYLAPLPLPTGAQPYCPYISGYSDTYLDFRGGEPNVFSYQLILGVPFTSACIVAFVFPLVMGFMGLTIESSAEEVTAFMFEFFLAIRIYAFYTWLAGSVLCFIPWLHAHNLFTKVIPTRFNRQRREVCFMPKDATEPLFVPWESLSAWVIEAQGATQYGVTRQYGMGMGFEHEGELVSLEFQCGGLQLAIANWEAVRQYMEYEISDMKAIQDPLQLQGPDDPPHEGMHTFRNARARLHRRIREKEVGWVYGFFWYLYHVMTLWTLPNRLVEWEIKRIAKVGRRELPAAMREWSEPLPPAQWAKPSSELLSLSAKVKALAKLDPRRPITDVFAAVYRNQPSAPRKG